jgi:hypothetical protein
MDWRTKRAIPPEVMEFQLFHWTLLRGGSGGGGRRKIKI